jgi:hypothetical protein
MSENAQQTPEVVDTVANDGMESVLSSNEAVDADLTWDNVEEAAPSLSSEGEGDDWESLGENEGNPEESSEELKAESAEQSGEESSEESGQVDAKSEEPEGEVKASESEDQSGEEESGSENQEVALSNETEIEVKIDGEVQKVSLQELKNNYSGKVAYDKKFSDLDRERKEYKAEVESINKYVNELGDTMKNASLLEGFYKVGELVGMAPHNLKQALIKELVPEINRLNDLSQDQVDLEFQRQETEYMKQKYEADQQKMKQEQAQAELQRSIDSVREANSINESEWDNAVKYLDEHLPPEDVITPELVGQYVNFNRAGERADNLLEKFDASLKDNKDVYNSLQDSIYENPSLDDNDFMELLQEAYGSAKKDEAQAKVDEAVQKKAPSKKKVEEKSGPQPEMVGDNEALDWDDLF